MTPPAPYVIDRDAVFTLPTLRATLGTAKNTLPREIRLGRLRVCKRGGRYYVQGEWVLEWLRQGEVRRRQSLPPAGVAANWSAVP